MGLLAPESSPEPNAVSSSEPPVQDAPLVQGSSSPAKSTNNVEAVSEAAASTQATHRYCDEILSTPVDHVLATGTASVITQRHPEKTSANEDAALVLSLSPTRGVLVVADGVGGHRAGERASAAVVDELARLAPGDTETTLRSGILNAIEQADDAIQKLNIGAATTVAVVEIDGDMIRPYHVGDSTILVVGQRGKVKFRTVAHSPVGYAYASDLVTEDEALEHEALHFVDNLVGCEPMRIEVGPKIRLAARDTVLVASDGLFDNLREDEIVTALCVSPLSDGVQALVNQAAARMATPSEDHPNKPDDLTIVAYRR